jgi:hypothetical protein
VDKGVEIRLERVEQHHDDDPRGEANQGKCRGRSARSAFFPHSGSQSGLTYPRC